MNGYNSNSLLRFYSPILTPLGSIGPIDGTLTGMTTTDQSGPGSNDNEVWLVGWLVLWHINPSRLFNGKSCPYIFQFIAIAPRSTLARSSGTLSKDQTELNCVLMLNWIAWNRTVLTFNSEYTKTILILN